MARLRVLKEAFPGSGRAMKLLRRSSVCTDSSVSRPRGRGCCTCRVALSVIAHGDPWQWYANYPRHGPESLPLLCGGTLADPDRSEAMVPLRAVCASRTGYKK